MALDEQRREETMRLSVVVGAGIAVAAALVLGSGQASATPASGVVP
jgi:hypothetical protein